MPYTPYLASSFDILNDLRFELKYSDEFYEKNDPELDGPHIHDFFEIYINVSGNVSFLVNSEIYGISSGDMLILNPNDVHYCIYNESCKHENYCLWVDAYNNAELYNYFKSLNIPKIYRFEAVVKENLLSDLEAYRSACIKNDEFNKALLFLKILKYPNDYENEGNKTEHNIPRVLRQALDIIDSDFTEISHISEILPSLYISHSTLDRLFAEHIHLSPKRFLEYKKLSFAEKLLSSDMSINEISYKAGFTDCSHFISAFKKQFGTTPHKYRKIRKNAE